MTVPIIAGPYRTFRRLNYHESFLEYEGSTITIPMKARADTEAPWMEDEIKLKAFMRLEVYPPYFNNLGTREFQFTIRDWDLYGSSPMLNELFFDNPRGHWRDSVQDYVPAVVTFNVANSYHIHVDNPAISAQDIFGSERDLEIRNLTSHHLRVWTQVKEHGSRWTYQLPQNRIYWQLHVPGGLDKDTRKRIGFDGDGAVLLFHKMPPSLGEFKASDGEHRARFLLAADLLDKDRDPKNKGEPLRIRATLSAAGLRANQVQLPGNAVISSLSRQREPVELHWTLSPKLGSVAALLKLLGDAGVKTLSGWIQISSPARSLGTADQRPDVGHPEDSADFPARITYAINYNIQVNKERFVEDQAGIAIAVGALEVPPRDVTVAFDKPHLGHVVRKYLEFGPGHCTGMHEIPESEYRAGLNFCRYWRTVPLEVNDVGWNSFTDYDPTKQY